MLGALTPAIFVSKSEVRRWPMVGSMCARGGTIFMQRERARDAARAKRAMQEALQLGLPVFIFPEGTTTNGLKPLPFHPALFAPAIDTRAPVWPLALSYWFKDGSSATAQLAYFGDVRFIPHFLGFMRLRGLCASVQASATLVVVRDRLVAAEESWDAIANLLHDVPLLAREHLMMKGLMPQVALTKFL